LVIFLSDNGIPFPGAKTTLYDSGVHLPLLVQRPGQKAGVVSDAMVSWTDLAPTVLDWCGQPRPKNQRGRSWLPILETPTVDGWDEVYGSHQFHEVTMYYPMRMIRTRTHKLILNLAHPLEYPFASDLWDSPTWQMTLKNDLKQYGRRTTAALRHRPAVELYDLVADPHEVQNLAELPAHADLLKQLNTKLLAWRQASADPWLIKLKHE
ncbi:MAG: sulfatase/phosphatase domain-containing protein, partial [Gemmataceae bacterium]